MQKKLAVGFRLGLDVYKVTASIRFGLAVGAKLNPP
jgi:hypothetical protein